MKTYFVSGTYEYEDPYKIENDDDYFSEILNWEAELYTDGDIKNIIVYDTNDNKYDIIGKIVKTLNNTRSLFKELSDEAQKKFFDEGGAKGKEMELYRRLKESISNEDTHTLLTQGTFINPLNNDEHIVDKDNAIGSFRITSSYDNVAVIDNIKKVTNGGLPVVMNHLIHIADRYKIILEIGNANIKQQNILSWYKSYGFIKEDDKLIRYPKN